MADIQVYECSNCGNTVEVDAEESKTPECCGNAMKPAEELKPCSLSTTAEQDRFEDFDEPCDDGRSGKI
jgi:Desulfoferrodoxin, N-terminal domain